MNFFHDILIYWDAPVLIIDSIKITDNNNNKYNTQINN